MMFSIAYRLEEELKKDYGTNIVNVSVNQQANAIQIKIKNYFGYATYTLEEDSLVEKIVKDVIETIQEDFVYGRTSDEEY